MAGVDVLPPAELLALLEADRVLLMLIHPTTNSLTSTQYPSFRSDTFIPSLNINDTLSTLPWDLHITVHFSELGYPPYHISDFRIFEGGGR